jgi:LmbE family N-acetylglucosaminyl deacetylase
MTKEKYNLLCVAHPDDETIFFSGLLQRRRSRPWKIICVTDGNADGDGAKRFRQFKKACSHYGAQFEWWGYPDIFERRLPIEDLKKKLIELPKPHEIFTHGPLGEYEHPHHQDVSFAVHSAFHEHPRLYSVAHNAFPELRIDLTAREFEVKQEILTHIYGSETTRFLNLLPATSSEGFLRVSFGEADAIYEYFTQGSTGSRPRLRTRSLRAYAWLSSYLKTRSGITRPF